MPSITERPESGLWKDYINPESVRHLGGLFRKAWPKFPVEKFMNAVLTPEFPKFELKARGKWVATVLHDFLPKDYAQTVDILIKVSPHTSGFQSWILTTYVEWFGLDHFDESVRAMKALTQHGTCESTIRPYLNTYMDRMLPILHRWAEHPSEHVRRLAAEGSRPRGVWIAHIPAFRKDPKPVLKLLARLKADPSLYVRKAVANNLNDISKDHPDIVISTALAWKADGNKDTDWIVKHACRTLIKKGHARVFPIFDFTPSPKLDLVKYTLTPKKIRIGGTGTLTLSVVSTSKKSQKLAIDYKMYFMKKNGKLLPKVFKWTEKTVKPGAQLDLTTSHPFVDHSTRTHQPGKQAVEVVINGTSLQRIEFVLSR
jgi:3-methyladenine DNA glycosylase AlkC